MAVTLNLQHTFTTRVVYHTEELVEIRKVLEEVRAALRNKLLKIKDHREKALACKRIAFMSRCLELDDEGMVLVFTRESLKQGLRQELESGLKELNVTRMSPVQTTKVSAQ